MENRKKLYIVSFGNSDKYRYVYTVPEGADALRKPSPFADLERRLSDYLHSRFPADNALATLLLKRLRPCLCMFHKTILSYEYGTCRWNTAQ